MIAIHASALCNWGSGNGTFDRAPQASMVIFSKESGELTGIA